MDKPPVKPSTADAKSPALVQAMEAELTRAMASLGSSGGPDPQKAAPRPYFLSYAVSDASNIDISAQYGAITASNGSHRRVADVQVRLGSPAEGQHARRPPQLGG